MFKRTLFKSYFINELDSDVIPAQFIQDRIKVVEKFIPELGKALSDYTDKTAKLRDCTDKMALILKGYAKNDNVTSALKLQISSFVSVLLRVGSKQDAQVHAMETEVLEQLSEYDKLCSQVQNELKMCLIANDKERNWMRHLKRIKVTHPQDQEQVSLAEAEFIKAKGESARSSKNLEEQIDIFEKKILDGLKEALLAWTLVELNFHSKALELFTDAYRIVADIDVNNDVKEFMNKLKSANSTLKSDSFRGSDSKLHLISMPFRRKAEFTGSGIPHPSSSIQSSPRSSQSANSSRKY